MYTKLFLTNGGFVALLLSSMLTANAWQQELPADHADCSYFGKDRAAFSDTGLNAKSRRSHKYSDMTEMVTSRLGATPTETFVPGGSRTSGQQASANPSSATIDNNIYGVFKAQNITPAGQTNDYEFVRRVTLDLAGKVPTFARTTAFVADKTADKRAKYVEELLASDAWVDKWTQYFGDMFKNTDTIVASGVVRRSNGREAFYDYIKSSLASNKPYDQMARELISNEGANSWEQGELNWILAGRVIGGPNQDIYDQMAVNVADTFLGVSQLNCVMCHNGRGHLDTLSLWGKQATRMDAWGMSAYFAPTNLAIVRTDPTNNNIYYWSVTSTKGRPYALNTTTGNRPGRAPVGTVNAVIPKYPFSAASAPANSNNLRQMAAAAVTTDFQFARATVNYMWKEFFSRGLVDPVKMFDLARLDPDNPPPAPWTLQPSNARLLKDLSQDFISAGYDLKGLQRQIVNSAAYQMSSTYPGTWNPNWEPLHARKLVRRLWSEEIADAVAQTSGLPTTYTFGTDVTDSKKVRSVAWAMQLPAPNVRSGEIAPIMDSFFRGDRDENERRSDGSDQQGLTMMNTAFVMNRTKSAVSGQNSSIVRQFINLPDDQLVDTLFLTILSRPPSDNERFAATSVLKSGNRLTAAENLTWALYNKVDFLFNY